MVNICNYNFIWKMKTAQTSFFLRKAKTLFEYTVKFTFSLHFITILKVDF